ASLAIRQGMTCRISVKWTFDSFAAFFSNAPVTIHLCVHVRELIDGEYQMTPFRETNLIVSPTFPHLNLTAQQIFDSVI
ncbi:MAG: hypothetical protein ACYT04_000000102330, partial [Nostoc sp.]